MTLKWRSWAISVLTQTMPELHSSYYTGKSQATHWAKAKRLIKLDILWTDLLSWSQFPAFQSLFEDWRKFKTLWLYMRMTRICMTNWIKWQETFSSWRAFTTSINRRGKALIYSFQILSIKINFLKSDGLSFYSQK